MQEEKRDFKQLEHKNNSFGERLRNVRKNKGLTQSDLAKQLGFKHNSPVSNLEIDKISPDIQTLRKIAEIFQVDLHWLITGENAPSSIEHLKAHQHLFAALGKYISWCIAFLLMERDNRYIKMGEFAKKDQADVDDELVKTIRFEIDELILRISELSKLQTEIQKILADLLNKKQ
jgi:transcriptional regulator with XRE-family HTH domain